MKQTTTQEPAKLMTDNLLGGARIAVSVLGQSAGNIVGLTMLNVLSFSAPGRLTETATNLGRNGAVGLHGGHARQAMGQGYFMQ